MQHTQYSTYVHVYMYQYKCINLSVYHRDKRGVEQMGASSGLNGSLQVSDGPSSDCLIMPEK